MTARHSSSPFRTTNLNLATYLILQGFEYKLTLDRVTKMGQPIGAWVFQDGEDDSVHVRAEEYSSGHALVEPKAYSRVLVTTRKEVINFSDKADEPSN